MPKSQSYVVVYDITCDQERRKVAKILEGFGFRVQKSAFECALSRSQHGKLQRRLDGLDIETGFVSIYRLYGSAKIVHIGVVPPKKDQGYAFIV